MTKQKIAFSTVAVGVAAFVALLFFIDNVRTGRFAAYLFTIVLAALISVLVRVFSTPGSWKEELRPRAARPEVHLRPWVKRLLGRRDE